MDRTRQKQIVVSIKNYDILKNLGHLRMTFDDVITELLIAKVGLQNQKQVGALDGSVAIAKGGVDSTNGQ